jgi:predicted phosphodiesterase
MRYAIVSDIHANWQAWSAVRDDFLKQGANAVVSLGDVIGYGPSPTRVFTDLRKHCHNFVLGNHDAAVTGWLDLGIFNETARRAAEWTMLWLDEKARAQMREWPLQVEGDRVAFVHAETVAPDAYGYVEQPADAKVCFEASEKSLIFLGHTHRQGIFALPLAGEVVAEEQKILSIADDTRYIVNVGSVGDPRDGTKNASYCLYDEATGRLELRQVSFDCAAFLAELKLHPELEVPWFLRSRPAGKVTLARDHAINVEEIQRRAPPKRGHLKVVRYSLGGPGGAAAKKTPTESSLPQAPATEGGEAAPVKSKLNNVMLLAVFGGALVLAAAVGGWWFWKQRKATPAPVLPTTLILPAAGTTPPPPAADRREPFELKAADAKLAGKTILHEEKNGIPNIGYWSAQNDSATWTTTVKMEGEFDVELDYGFARRGGSGAIVLLCGDKQLNATLPPTANWDTFQRSNIGRIRLSSGPLTIVMKPGKNRGPNLVNLRSITFWPTKN